MSQPSYKPSGEKYLELVVAHTLNMLCFQNIGFISLFVFCQQVPRFETLQVAGKNFGQMC
jgi:hypothetical protein